MLDNVSALQSRSQHFEIIFEQFRNFKINRNASSVYPTTEEAALFLSSFSFRSWASSLLLTIWFKGSLDHRDIFSSKWGHPITYKIEGIDSDDKILKADLASLFCTLSSPYKFSKDHSAHFISDVCIPDFSTIDWSFLINFRNIPSLNSNFHKNIQISPNAKSRSVLIFFWIFLKCLAIAYKASVLSFNNIFHLIFRNSAFHGKSFSEFTRYWRKARSKWELYRLLTVEGFSSCHHSNYALLTSLVIFWMAARMYLSGF